jgi:hypothetical protein
MTDDKLETSRPQNSVDDLLAQLLRAILELFRPAPLSSPILASRMREEREAEEAAEARILQRYAGAAFYTAELERRAKARGVIFAPALRAEYRAAILDFLDNPDAPTPLTGMHMTWFWGAGPDGRSTASRMHPVNRAIYRWNARDVARMRPYGDPSSDAALHRLRTIHYPLDRCDWTAAQWAAHEQQAAPSRPLQVKATPPTLASTSNGVPTIL